MIKNPPAILGSIPGLGRSPGGGYDNPLQYSFPGESPQTEETGGLQSVGHKESDMAEKISTTQHIVIAIAIFV